MQLMPAGAVLQGSKPAAASVSDCFGSVDGSIDTDFAGFSVAAKAEQTKKTQEATTTGDYARANQLLSTGTAAITVLSIVGLIPVAVFSRSLASAFLCLLLMIKRVTIHITAKKLAASNKPSKLLYHEKLISLKTLFIKLLEFLV